MPPILNWAWAIVAFPLAGFLANGWLAFFRPNAKRAVSVIGVGVLAASFVSAVAMVWAVASTHPADPYIIKYFSWIGVGNLQIDLAFQLDQLSAVMLMVITGVGTLIHIFSVGYMREDPAYPRYFAYLNLFVFFMLILVLGASFPLMFVGWEGVGLCSYLLIGFWYTEKANADAGKKAFIMNRIGDFGFLVAMFMIFNGTGTLDFTGVIAQAPRLYGVGSPAITLITLFLFLGCTGKSAQIPLYTWLPDAMAGPTPVSALIHAATMVTAGVYLIARTNVLFAMAPATSALVASVGAVTALFAASIALKQWDIKKVLAYSTVSQLGYMFLGVGTGAYAAGVFHLVTHAFFKALLFLGSGSVIHALHQAYHHSHKHDDAQDMRNMGGLKQWMPYTFIVMWIATLAIAGVPPLSGFFSKDEILGAAFARGSVEPLFYVLWGVGSVAALMTAFYMTRLMIYTFHGPNRTGAESSKHLHEAPWIMTGPLVVLALGTVVAGILNIPEVMGHPWLEHWLEPLTATAVLYRGIEAAPAGLEWGLLGGAVVVAALGIVGAFRILKPAELVPAHDAKEETGFEKILLHKWYVDELYDKIVVRPIGWLSDRVLWKVVDAGIVDGAGVNGSARVARFVGWIGSRLQTGSVGAYVFFFVVGVVAILWKAAR